MTLKSGPADTRSVATPGGLPEGFYWEETEDRIHIKRRRVIRKDVSIFSAPKHFLDGNHTIHIEHNNEKTGIAAEGISSVKEFKAWIEALLATGLTRLSP